jgi:hypothetical protein
MCTTEVLLWPQVPRHFFHDRPICLSLLFIRHRLLCQSASVFGGSSRLAAGGFCTLSGFTLSTKSTSRRLLLSFVLRGPSLFSQELEVNTRMFDRLGREE